MPMSIVFLTYPWLSESESSLHGVFDPRALPALADLRLSRLKRPKWYAEPSFLPHLEMTATELLGGSWRSTVDASGAIKVSLDRDLSTNELIRVGRDLGPLIPERAPSVQSYVEEGVVLNLKTELPVTSDIALQPFAENFITLHTEGSFAALDLQPRYLVFLCLVPSAPDCGGQTLVLPFCSLVDRLSASVVETLLHTTLDDTAGVPVLRRIGSRLVLCFRDRENAPIGWESPVKDADVVNHALGSLLLTMYSAPELAGIHWTAPSMVVLDNLALLHGRSQTPLVSQQPSRHIKRVRVRVA